MPYRVSLSAPAETDAYTAFERIRQGAPKHNGQWQPESGTLPGHS
jgi:hypothetical protein